METIIKVSKYSFTKDILKLLENVELSYYADAYNVSIIERYIVTCVCYISQMHSHVKIIAISSIPRFSSENRKEESRMYLPSFWIPHLSNGLYTLL